MADFSALKTAIQNAIRTNGNNEITGQLLQDILLSMVVELGDEAITNVADDLSNETSQRRNADVTLQGNINAEATARGVADAALQNAINTINSNFSNGYVYAGIATPSATPATGKVFYIATTAGTYTNFGGLTVTKGINILKYNGSSWSQEQIIGIDDYPTAGSSKLALSGGVDAEIKSLVGYYTCGTAAATAAKTITASAYILLQGGSIKVKFTYKNTAADATLKIGSADAKPLFYGGRRAGSSNSWEAGEVVEIFYDGTNYMANNVMGGGAGDGAFDISVYNAVDGTPTPYNDLAAALGTNGANIPEHLRKGGMSVKFIQGTVQSSDNNYVKFFCTADEFTTDVTKWQGVDDEPVEGSNNLAKSGTLARIYDILQVKPVTQTMSESLNGKFINPNSGSVGTYSPTSISNAISVKKGDLVVATMKCNDAVSAIAKVVTLNLSWQNKVTGIDSSDVIDYYYAVENDCDLQFTYFTNKGISVKVYSSDVINSVDLINKGYIYRGIATANSTPSDVSGKLFYLALNDGTYTNYGNLTVNAGLTILKYDGSSWSKDLLIGVDEVPTAASKNLVESGGVEKETSEIKVCLGFSKSSIETTIELDGKYIQYNISSIGSYAPEAITAPFTLNKGESIRVKISQTETAYAIAKKNGTNSYTGLVRGIESTWNNPSYYTYTASSDNEQICICYKKSAGIEVIKIASQTISRIENETAYNYQFQSGIVAYGAKAEKIRQLIKSIKLFTTDLNSSLDGYDFRLRYIGFHDSSISQYQDKLVVQIVLVNQDNSTVILCNDFALESWEKGKVLSVNTVINEIPVKILIELSDNDIVTYPVTNVTSSIIPYTGYLLPKKELVQPSFKNLINPNNVLDQWMVNGGNGTFEEIGSPWCLVKWIVVKGLSQITFGINGVAGNTEMYSYAFYNAQKQYINGATVYPNGATTINVPSGAVFLCYTDKNYNTQRQVNAGNTIQPYDTYIKPYYMTKKDEAGIDWFFNANSTPNVIHVGNGDEYDYSEIQDAINAIWDNSETTPYVIFVHPKNIPYAPFSMIRQSFSTSYPWSNNKPKNISIIGLDKVNCVIQSNTGDYYHPAAELLANGTIKNLTFRMTNSEHQASSTQGGYAAHIDARTYNDVGYHMIIQNCDFESATGPAIGIGTHKNSNLELVGCRFVSTADPTYNPIEGYTNMANWGCVFAHSSTVSEATNQKLSFINCQGESKLGSKSIRISNSGSTTLLVTLMRNIFWATAQSAPVYDLAGTLSYNPMNYGNNIPT